MAGIDKTYLVGKQLRVAYEWIDENPQAVFIDGRVEKLVDWLYYPEEYYNRDLINDDEEYILWNTPIWFDYWLLHNCPLKFIQDRLREQYTEESIFNMQENIPTYLHSSEQIQFKLPYIPKTDFPAYFFISTLGTNLRGEPCYWYVRYNVQVDKWVEDRNYPSDDGDYRIVGVSSKKIARLINKWHLPKGTKIELTSVKFKTIKFIL